MRTNRIWTGLLLCGLLPGLLLSLTACGSTDSAAEDAQETAVEEAAAADQTEDGGTAAESSGSAEAAEEAADGTGYQITYADLDSETSYIYGGTIYDGQLWLSGGYYDYNYGIYYNTLLSLDADGTVTGEILLPDSDGMSISGMMVPTDDGILAIAYIYTFVDYTEEETEWDYGLEEEIEEYYALTTWSMEGELLSTQAFPVDESSDWFYVEKLVAGADGTLYYYCDTTLYVSDRDLNTLYTVSTPSYIYDLQISPDGQVLVCYYDEDWNASAALLDTEKQTLDSALDFGLSSGEFFSWGFGLDGELYAWNEDSLWFCDPEEETALKLVSWLDWDVDGSNAAAVTVLESGDILVFGYNAMTGDPEVVTMTQVPLSELPDKIEITFGTASLDYDVRQAILEYNRNSDTYHITVVEYSTTVDTSGYTQFEKDILSGEIPDILDAGSLDLTALTRQGQLTDLYTLMGDGTVAQEDFVSGYLAAMETDGSLYTISPVFRVMTLLGGVDYVGTEQGWSLTEFTEAAEAFPGVLWEEMTSESFLLWVLECAFDSYVDLENGTCSFDEQEFVDLLNAAALFPEDAEDSEVAWVIDDDYYISQYELVCDGSVLLQTWQLYSFDDLRSNKVLALESEDLNLVGVPGTAGNGALILPECEFAISASSEYQQAAWEFLCTLMEEDFVEQYGFGLPVLQSAFDSVAEEAMEPYYYTDEDGTLVEYSDYPALTQAQVDAVVSLIENASGRYYYDEKIEEIVSDEAASFFAGSKSAETVAAGIQNRVQTYLDEQG